jgi:hypothetical protein
MSSQLFGNFRWRSPTARARHSGRLSAFTSVRFDFRVLQNRGPKCPPIDNTMEAPMGKTFALFSTDPIVQRRLREAHAARNAYLRSLIGALAGRCRTLFARSRALPSPRLQERLQPASRAGR